MVTVGATPLSSVDVNEKFFVLPTETVKSYIPAISGGSLSAEVTSKKKSIGIFDFAVPLSSLSSTMITATQSEFVVLSTASLLVHPEHVTLSWTSHSIKPSVVNVIPVGTEKVELVFDNDGIDKIAELATEINQNVENIGARRLHTIMEKLLEDVSYNASDMGPQKININTEYVEKNLGELIKSQDLSKFIL